MLIPRISYPVQTHALSRGARHFRHCPFVLGDPGCIDERGQRPPVPLVLPGQIMSNVFERCVEYRSSPGRPWARCRRRGSAANRFASSASMSLLRAGVFQFPRPLASAASIFSDAIAPRRPSRVWGGERARCRRSASGNPRDRRHQHVVSPRAVILRVSADFIFYGLATALLIMHSKLASRPRV